MVESEESGRRAVLFAVVFSAVIQLTSAAEGPIHYVEPEWEGIPETGGFPEIPGGAELPRRAKLSVSLNSSVQIDLSIYRRHNFSCDHIAITLDDGKKVPSRGGTKEFTGFYFGQEMEAILLVYCPRGKCDKRQITGTFSKDGTIYEIEPVTDRRGLNDLQKNKLNQSHDPRQHSHVVRIFGLPYPDKVLSRYPRRRHSADDHTRTKRRAGNFTRRAQTGSSPFFPRPVDLRQKTFYVELMFLLDISIYKFWLEEYSGNQKKALDSIKYYYTHVFHGMYTAFAGINIPDHGYKVTLWLKEIRVVTMESFDKKITVTSEDGDEIDLLGTEKRLFIYMDNNNFQWYKLDAMIFFTRKNMVVDGFTDDNTGILGLAADVCAVCDIGLCQVYDHGLFAWATAAHELAHLLGAHHDGTDNDCDPDSNYLMAPQSASLLVPSYKNSFKFSKCSTEMMKSCFQGELYRGKDIFFSRFPRVCVFDPVCAHGHPVSSYFEELPGQRIGLNEQCELGVGVQGATLAKCGLARHNICRLLLCDIPNGASCTIGSNVELRAFVGTPCDSIDPKQATKFCYQGECKPRHAFDYLAPGTADASVCQTSGCSLPGNCQNSPKTLTGGMDCDFVVQVWPYECFSSTYTRAHCKRSCFELGLHTVEAPICYISRDNPCYTQGMPAHHSMQQTTKLIFTYCSTDVFSEEAANWRIQCPNFPDLCVEMTEFCDGTVHCPDGLDELREYCENVPSGKPGYVRCPGSPHETIMSSWMCDGNSDCPEATDESSSACSTNKPAEFCFDKQKALESDLKSKYNCPDDPTICLNGYKFCDGTEDCPSGGDEDNHICSAQLSTEAFVTSIYSTEVQPSEETYFTELVISQDATTDDSAVPTSDEQIGPMPESDNSTFFRICGWVETDYSYEWVIECPSDPSICIAVWWACDEYVDCPDAEDENPDFCNNVPTYQKWTRCPSDPFMIVHEQWLCDGAPDCTNSEDEDTKFCNDHIRYCFEDYVNCPDEPKRCVHVNSLCDGYADCPAAGADEDKSLCDMWKTGE